MGSTSVKELRGYIAAKSKEIAPLAQRMLESQLEGDELVQFNSLRSELEDLQGQLADAQTTEEQRAEDRKEAQRLVDMHAEYNTPVGRSISGRVPTTDARSEVDTRSMGERFVESDAFKRYRDSEVGRGGRSQPVNVETAYDPIERRALITSTTLDPIIQPHRIPGIMAVEQPELRMRDIFPNGQTDSNMIEYVMEGTLTNGAAEVADPTSLTGVGVAGGVKPESGFTLDEGSAPVRTIATIMYIHRNALDDAPLMRSYIDQLLRRFVAEREDRQLLLGDGVSPNLLGVNNVSGRQNLNGAYWTSVGKADYSEVDRIRHAITRIRLGGRGRASSIILNPLDLEAFELMKKSDTSGEYLLPNGGPFGTATVPRLWAKPVVEHEDQPAGFATVLDGRAAMVIDRMNAKIYITDSNRDLFERNILTLLVESRLAFPIFAPQKIAYVDLTATA